MVSTYFFRMRSLNPPSSAKIVILYFLYHNCGNMWPFAQRRRHMSVEGQNHPPVAEEIGMKQPYKYAQKP